MNQDIKLPEGPFWNEEVESNVKPYRRVKSRPPIDHARFQREIVEYFERRLQRLQIVKTTTTPRGQTIDWIPIESQHPRGEIASPPPTPDYTRHKMSHSEQPELPAKAELEYTDVERGPKGTVPILRKNLLALSYTKSLKKYLSKSHGHRIISLRGMGLPAPEEDGNHRYAASGQSIICFGGEGQLSCFDPYVETSDDFSLIQIGLSNRDLGFLQTVEAGWQESQDIMGDWVPHLFTPYSTRSGDQYKITIKYQLYQGNWWLSCQGRWAGYYPASLFMGNQSVFSTLGDHADHIGFWGEIFDSDDVSGRTTSDMGSGYFAEAGWTWAAYMHNLLVQTNRGGSMGNYDGSLGILITDPDMYDIDAHFNSESTWGSYVFLGGPGAG